MISNTDSVQDPIITPIQQISPPSHTIHSQPQTLQNKLQNQLQHSPPKLPDIMIAKKKITPSPIPIQIRNRIQVINKSQKQPQQKLKKPILEAEKRSIFNNVDGCYRYYIGWGNNEVLVKRVMQKRVWWKDTTESNTMLVNFKWQQSNRGYRYDRLLVSQNYKQVVNHFEHHQELSNKQYLLKNLTNYCEQHKLNVFEYTPLTFVFDFADDQCDNYVCQFLKIYEQYMPNYMKKLQGDGLTKYMLDHKRRLRGHFTQGHYNYKDQLNTTKYKLPITFLSGEDSKYLWLLKPTFLNRGRGIHIFSTLENLSKLIQEYQEGYVEKSLATKKDRSDDEQDSPKQTPTTNPNQRSMQASTDVSVQKHQLSTLSTNALNPVKSQQLQQQQQKKKKLETKKLQQQQQTQQPVDPNTYIRSMPTGPCVIKSHAFVVQKYIERPTLIHQRKFDIRVWGLVTHDLEAYFFSEGYIRTSCEEFKAEDADNQFIHLTNNAIQKFSSNYGQFESGNQLSWKQYEEYLAEKKQNVKIKDIIERMKELAWIAFLSVKRKLNFEDRKYCFEIFGFDFIIDESYAVYLIEVNTNPCIEESSPVLQILLPRMLDDAFKLTIDVLFPPKKGYEIPQMKTTKSMPNLPSLSDPKQDDTTYYPVPGYANEENMWTLLGTLNERRKPQIDKKKSEK